MARTILENPCIHREQERLQPQILEYVSQHSDLFESHPGKDSSSTAIPTTIPSQVNMATTLLETIGKLPSVEAVIDAVSTLATLTDCVSDTAKSIIATPTLFKTLNGLTSFCYSPSRSIDKATLSLFPGHTAQKAQELYQTARKELESLEREDEKRKQTTIGEKICSVIDPLCAHSPAIVSLALNNNTLSSLLLIVRNFCFERPSDFSNTVTLPINFQVPRPEFLGPEQDKLGLARGERVVGDRFVLDQVDSQLPTPKRPLMSPPIPPPPQMLNRRSQHFRRPSDASSSEIFPIRRAPSEHLLQYPVGSPPPFSLDFIRNDSLLQSPDAKSKDDSEVAMISDDENSLVFVDQPGTYDQLQRRRELDKMARMEEYKRRLAGQKHQRVAVQALSRLTAKNIDNQETFNDDDLNQILKCNNGDILPTVVKLTQNPSTTIASHAVRILATIVLSTSRHSSFFGLHPLHIVASELNCAMILTNLMETTNLDSIKLHSALLLSLLYLNDPSFKSAQTIANFLRSRLKASPDSFLQIHALALLCLDWHELSRAFQHVQSTQDVVSSLPSLALISTSFSIFPLLFPFSIRLPTVNPLFLSLCNMVEKQTKHKTAIPILVSAIGQLAHHSSSIEANTSSRIIQCLTKAIPGQSESTKIQISKTINTLLRNTTYQISEQDKEIRDFISSCLTSFNTEQIVEGIALMQRIAGLTVHLDVVNINTAVLETFPDEDIPIEIEEPDPNVFVQSPVIHPKAITHIFDPKVLFKPAPLPEGLFGEEELQSVFDLPTKQTDDKLTLAVALLFSKVYVGKATPQKHSALLVYLKEMFTTTSLSVRSEACEALLNLGIDFLSDVNTELMYRTSPTLLKNNISFVSNIILIFEYLALIPTTSLSPTSPSQHQITLAHLSDKFRTTLIQYLSDRLLKYICGVFTTESDTGIRETCLVCISSLLSFFVSLSTRAPLYQFHVHTEVVRIEQAMPRSFPLLSPFYTRVSSTILPLLINYTETLSKQNQFDDYQISFLTLVTSLLFVFGPTRIALSSKVRSSLFLSLCSAIPDAPNNLLLSQILFILTVSEWRQAKIDVLSTVNHPDPASLLDSEHCYLRPFVHPFSSLVDDVSFAQLVMFAQDSKDMSVTRLLFVVIAMVVSSQKPARQHSSICLDLVGLVDIGISLEKMALSLNNAVSPVQPNDTSLYSEVAMNPPLYSDTDSFLVNFQNWSLPGQSLPESFPSLPLHTFIRSRMHISLWSLRVLSGLHVDTFRDWLYSLKKHWLTSTPSHDTFFDNAQFGPKGRLSWSQDDLDPQFIPHFASVELLPSIRILYSVVQMMNPDSLRDLFPVFLETFVPFLGVSSTPICHFVVLILISVFSRLQTHSSIPPLGSSTSDFFLFLSRRIITSHNPDVTLQLELFHKAQPFLGESELRSVINQGMCQKLVSLIGSDSDEVKERSIALLLHFFSVVEMNTEESQPSPEVETEPTNDDEEVEGEAFVNVTDTILFQFTHSIKCADGVSIISAAQHNSTNESFKALVDLFLRKVEGKGVIDASILISQRIAKDIREMNKIAESFNKSPPSLRKELRTDTNSNILHINFDISAISSTQAQIVEKFKQITTEWSNIGDSEKLELVDNGIVQNCAHAASVSERALSFFDTLPDEVLTWLIPPEVEPSPTPNLRVETPLTEDPDSILSPTPFEEYGLPQSPPEPQRLVQIGSQIFTEVGVLESFLDENRKNQQQAHTEVCIELARLIISILSIEPLAVYHILNTMAPICLIRQFIHEVSEEQREQILVALSPILSESNELTNHFIQIGGLDHISTFLNSSHEPLVYSTLILLSSLNILATPHQRFSNTHPFFGLLSAVDRTESAIDSLERVANSSSERLSSRAAVILFQLHSNAIIGHNLVSLLPCLMRNAESDDPLTASESCIAIAGLAIHEENHQALLEAEVVRVIKNTINLTRPSLCLPALWIIDSFFLSHATSSINTICSSVDLKRINRLAQCKDIEVTSLAERLLKHWRG
ncbi:hypothetical protein BLNAU_10308 [Blattamonas nauphoetae]|uniref:Uncharacterized protein n=1 Tax=Blattamonas nauphoetae TaxID=2049346 RepID=A0ABQ9XT55_9EUKA|nr:hypothetical protein BLNAU_10308 [Blattamonas nauphoetae]